MQTELTVLPYNVNKNVNSAHSKSIIILLERALPIYMMKYNN